MTNTPNNFHDVIDSRDVIARIEELETVLQGAYDAKYEEAYALWHKWCQDPDTEMKDEPPEPPFFETWLDDVRADNTHEMQGEAEELHQLRELASQAEDCGDWMYGETLIRKSYFETYVQELADELGYIKPEVSWPYNCIDWERAARELQMDYTCVDFDGVEYLMRS